jgi:hypothetical protein
MNAELPNLFTGVRGRGILRNSGACWSRVSFTSSHLYALPQHVVSPRMLPDVEDVP